MASWTTRSKQPATIAAVAALATTLSIVGCGVDASSADPESKTFSYSGDTLHLDTNEVATKVIVTDRDDIKVTRWFDSRAGNQRLVWELEGDALEIDAGCSGIAICDAKFEVEIPKGLTVVKDGVELETK
ncbi:hypothetical protein [Phytoactinopolyspora limicola]|uniref:hypothetical protein n=1 Tax=Phytoactinopolyspora limicola TaxID=2715536 RepID=UPI00140AE99B|nr:hypothetical protein [Phytoactinopolyspora limicola]